MGPAGLRGLWAALPGPAARGSGSSVRFVVAALVRPLRPACAGLRACAAPPPGRRRLRGSPPQCFPAAGPGAASLSGLLPVRAAAPLAAVPGVGPPPAALLLCPRWPGGGLGLLAGGAFGGRGLPAPGALRRSGRYPAPLCPAPLRCRRSSARRGWCRAARRCCAADKAALLRPFRPTGTAQRRPAAPSPVPAVGSQLRYLWTGLFTGLCRCAAVATPRPAAGFRAVDNP